MHTDLVDRQIADQARVHHMSETEVVENVLLAESAIKSMTTPDMVASLVVWLASENAAMVTGASYPMDGGWSAS